MGITCLAVVKTDSGLADADIAKWKSRALSGTPFATYGLAKTAGSSLSDL